MSTVLVTGASGFIGHWVSSKLVEAGHRVIAVDDFSGSDPDGVPPQTVFHEASVVDSEYMDFLFTTYHPRFVVHCAAYAAEILSPHIRAFNYTNNTVGSAVLINQAAKHGLDCFIFLSSIAVMGHQEPPFTEDQTPAPADPYGIAKYAVELDLKAARNLWGLPYVVFRPHNVIGPRQSLNDPFRNAASIFIRQALEGKPMTIFGTGEQTRAFSPVGQVASVIASTVDRPETWNQVYNIGADQAMSVLDLAKTICRIMGIPENFAFLEPRHEALHAYMDHGKVRRAFPDLMESGGVEECLAAMVAEARLQPIKPLKPFRAIEVHRGMPPAWRRFFQ